MKFGFARISKRDQNLDRQIDLLIAKGVKRENIIVEKLSGRKEQVKLDKLVQDKMREGDTLVVESVGRLGLTIKELINLLDYLKVKDIAFISLKERIDTSTAMGQALMQNVAILKQMEVEILRERTMERPKSARARGRKGGRPKGTYNKIKANAAARQYTQGVPVGQIIKDLEISTSTLYNYLRREGVKK
ncbi:MAG: recombinase family protein [Bacteroidota bacterium]